MDRSQKGRKERLLSRTEKTANNKRAVQNISRAHLLHKCLDTDPINYVSDLFNSLELCDNDKSQFSTYLKVLSVAIPFSTGSGVLVRSCDVSLGAIFFAQTRRITNRTTVMKYS
jgi:hypothetical protein